jgi:hypothetical protein
MMREGAARAHLAEELMGQGDEEGKEGLKERE